METVKRGTRVTWRQSALLIETVIVLAVAGTGCGSESGSIDPDDIAGRLCQRFEDCGLLSTEYRPLCLVQTKAVAMYVIDPARVGTCLEAAGCERLQQDSEALIGECLDLDMASFACQGSRTLHYCSNAGACVELDCLLGCQQAFDGVGSAECGFDQEDQHDKCLCYL